MLALFVALARVFILLFSGYVIGFWDELSRDCMVFLDDVVCREYVCA